MSYRIAGIDVHKRMLAVVVADVEVESEYTFERRKFSSTPEQLCALSAWLLEATWCSSLTRRSSRSTMRSKCCCCTR